MIKTKQYYVCRLKFEDSPNDTEQFFIVNVRTQFLIFGIPLRSTYKPLTVNGRVPLFNTDISAVAAVRLLHGEEVEVSTANVTNWAPDRKEYTNRHFCVWHLGKNDSNLM